MSDPQVKPLAQAIAFPTTASQSVIAVVERLHAVSHLPASPFM